MPTELYRFGDFELDRGAYQLRRAGRDVRLERIPLDVLFLLVERGGRLVTREEILERVWGKDVFVDVDNSINTAVRKIRQALRDNPESPRFVHTISGKGYRFEASFLQEEPSGSPVSASVRTEAAVVPSEVPPRPAPSGPTTRRIRLWPFWLSLTAMLVAAVFITRPYLRRAQPNPGRVMMVVLPFENLSGDPQQEFFADGVTEEMITQLGGLDPAHLGVIARTSAMQYKHAQKDAAQIARELGVSYLLEGSVRRDAGRVRITAQLIQSSDQTHIWADSFDRDQSDVLKLQSEVVRAIADKIQLTLSQQVQARLSAVAALNVEAHEAYLEGLQA